MFTIHLIVYIHRESKKTQYASSHLHYLYSLNLKILSLAHSPGNLQ